MTTLAEERAAIRDGISASRESTSNRVNTAEAGRKASGAAIKNGRISTSQEDRRNLGASLERQRRGTTLKQDLNSLETPRRASQTLAPRQATGGRPATRGVGTWDPNKPPAGGGGGVASPLAEQTKVVGADTVPDRDYWPDLVLTSSDGIFTYEVPPVKTLKLKDANDADVIVNLAQPVAP